MDKRIKTVYMITIVAILAFLGMQVFWLYGRYRYTLSEYEAGAFSDIVATFSEFKKVKTEIGKADTLWGSTPLHSSQYIMRDSIDSENRHHLVASLIHREANIFEILNIEAPRPLTDNEKNRVDDLLSRGFAAVDSNLVTVRQITSDATSAPSRGAVWAALTHADSEFTTPLTVAYVSSRLDSLGIVAEVELNISDTIRWIPTVLHHAAVFTPTSKFSIPYSELERKNIIIKYRIPVGDIFHDMIGSLIVVAILSVFLILCLCYQFSTILKLSRLDKMRNSFITSMIHELKRPISTLKMCVSGIESEKMMEQPEVKQELFSEMRMALDNLSSYFSKLRDITFNDVEQIPLNLQSFNLRNLISEVASGWVASPEKTISFINSVDSDIEVLADRSHLHNILVNLVENAVKYSDDRVEITIDANSQDGIVEIIVSDNGHGISTDELRYVFERFFRGKGASRMQTGMGLGLSYVKLLVEAHGGEVGVDSKEGKGTTFTIKLPQE